MSSIADVLIVVQQSILHYGFPILLALGNLGNLFCMVIFSQKWRRCNSCSLYLLAAAVFSLVGVNWGLGSNIYAIYYPPDPFSIYIGLCRIRGYILQTSSILYRTMMVLACADRFAVSSIRAKIRAFSRRHVALRMIGITTLFWMVASIHLPILETIENARCGVAGLYGLIFSIYQIVIFGLVPPILMIIFGLLVLKNLKESRTRVQPVQGSSIRPLHRLHQRDRNLMLLVLAEALVSIFLTFPYPVVSLYFVLASNIPNKSRDRIQIEAFLLFISLTVLLYLNYCVTFYLYVVISKSFRQQIKRIVLKALQRTV